jgi:hypothetical protein
MTGKLRIRAKCEVRWIRDGRRWRIGSPSLDASDTLPVDAIQSDTRQTNPRYIVTF